MEVERLQECHQPSFQVVDESKKLDYERLLLFVRHNEDEVLVLGRYGSWRSMTVQTVDCLEGTLLQMDFTVYSI